MKHIIYVLRDHIKFCYTHFSEVRFHTIRYGFELLRSVRCVARSNPLPTTYIYQLAFGVVWGQGQGRRHVCGWGEGAQGSLETRQHYQPRTCQVGANSTSTTSPYCLRHTHTSPTATAALCRMSSGSYRTMYRRYTVSPNHMAIEYLHLAQLTSMASEM